MTKIAIVGEAWGDYEESQRAPFIGPAGRELTRMLSEAGIHRSECFLTNCFNLRPRPTLDVANLFQEAKSGLPPYNIYQVGPRYLRPEYHSELDRLFCELASVRPNVCVLAGNTACWALLGGGSISKLRGVVTSASPIGTGSQHIRFLKCIPTYHPSHIIRPPFGWNDRPVTVLDLKKAKRESEFPEIRRPHRAIHFVENLADLETVEMDLQNARSIAFDIETMGDQITCIGFAPSEAIAYVIPFYDPRSPTHSFWGVSEEIQVWQSVSRILNLPCRKIAQNGMYDVTFLWRAVGIPVRNFEEDTMLLHHALQPESEKGLAFLGSVYTNESSWKLLRTRGKTTIKRDE